jgi:hypothetical protein
MTEESILITVDDSQLDAALLKLDLLGTKAAGIIGAGGRGGKKLDTKLPGINRELRLILGQIPGLREAMMYYFRIKRLERGMAVGGTQFYLTIIATAILLIRELQQHQRRVERQKVDLEMLIRKSRGWTQDEYERGRAEWEEYSRSMPG